MMRARMVSSLTLSRLSAFARGKRGIFRVVSIGDQSAGCETEGKSCSHYKTEYFICRCPHYASPIFLQLSGIMSCLKSIKQGQSTPPPEKTKQYIVLLACNHTKKPPLQECKGLDTINIARRKEEHGRNCPASNAAGEARRQRPAPCGGEKHSGSSAAPYSKRAALWRLSFGFFGCFGANPRSRETLSPFAQDARRAAALRLSARFGKARCTKRRAA